MTALIPTTDHGLLTRRGIFVGAAACLICMPAVVRVTKLMPVRRLTIWNDGDAVIVLRRTGSWEDSLRRLAKGC
jgi:hypothetical protein